MTVNGLDHINIQTRDMAATVRFFTEVLDLAEGAPPGELDPTRVRWLFDAAGRPLVHLSSPGALLGETDDRAVAGHTGPLHHVALDCSGHAAMLARLDRLGLPCRRNTVASIGLEQIFVSDPNGVLLELNFRGG